MSGAESFFDTSVLLYLLSGEAEKADRAETLLEQSGVISVQVLDEFTVVAIRKLGLSFAEVREVLGVVRSLCVTHPLTIEHHDKGTAIAERYGFSFYDSVIVASALLASCKTLYSEELQHRQIIEKQLAVINPFASARG
jgi:predicted nucleic acid-binding protein